MRCLESKRLEECDFDCAGFKTLFNAAKDTYSNSGWSALMVLCDNNPRLLGKKIWFITELLTQVGHRVQGGNALSVYRAREPDQDSEGYIRLLQAQLFQAPLSAEPL